MKSYLPHIAAFVIAAGLTGFITKSIRSAKADKAEVSEQVTGREFRSNRRHLMAPRNNYHDSIAHHVADFNREARNLHSFSDITTHLEGSGKSPLYINTMREYLISQMSIKQLWLSLENQEFSSSEFWAVVDRLATEDPELVLEKIGAESIPFDSNEDRADFNMAALTTIVEKQAPEFTLDYLHNTPSGIYNSIDFIVTNRSICYKDPEFAIKNFERMASIQIRNSSNVRDGDTYTRPRLAHFIAMAWEEKLGKEQGQAKLLEYIDSLPEGKQRQAFQQVLPEHRRKPGYIGFGR